MRSKVRTLLACACTLGCILTAHAQEPNPARQKRAIELYAGAKPYMDLPIKVLRKQVSELDGLKEITDQTTLPTILQKAAGVLEAQLPRIPNIVAQEEVTRLVERQPFSGAVGIGRRAGPTTSSISTMETVLVPADVNRYEYIIHRTTDDKGISEFHETRRTPDGGGDPKVAPLGTGFGSIWMFFIPGIIQEQRFLYLGKQKVKGHMTDVVAFQQIPNKVVMPGSIMGRDGDIPMLQQGIAWIDETTSQIVRIRTDLLAPLPQFQIEQTRSTVDFSEVKLRGYESTLWLPRRVNIEWNMYNNHAGEQHDYTNYRLFTAKVRILE